MALQPKAFAVALLLLASQAAAADKRPLPDYDGRGGEPVTVGDVLLWVPRVLLAPPYLVSEYIIRRPLGAAIAGAERAGLPGALYDFFTFGPDHNVGILPTGFVDFGFRPSVGLFTFWNDAGALGNDLRLQLGFLGVRLACGVGFGPHPFLVRPGRRGEIRCLGIAPPRLRLLRARTEHPPERSRSLRIGPPRGADLPRQASGATLGGARRPHGPQGRVSPRLPA